MKITIKLTPLRRVFALTLLILSVLSYIWFHVQFIHYVIYPFLKAPSLARPHYLRVKPRYLYNGVLYVLFFLQHIGMSSVTFKKTMSSISNLYPLFERQIYNIISSIAYILIMRYSVVSNYTVYEMPRLIHLLLIGAPLYIWGIIQLFGSLVDPIGIDNILHRREVEVTYDEKKKHGIISTGVFRIVRNPLATGMICILLGCTHYWSIERVIFTVLNIVGILIGTWREERNLRKENMQYGEYSSRVPNRYIPTLPRVFS